MSPTMPATFLPPSCDVAFKEWAAVCDAIGSGRQSLILRKGGTEEGPGGFRPEHPAFWLYPTAVHQAEQGVRERPSRPSEMPPPGFADLDVLAIVVEFWSVDRIEALESLAAEHVWSGETVLRRFSYRRPGLWVLGVRAYRSGTPRRIEATAAHAGCKTWVPLGRPLSTEGLEPVLNGEEFARRMALLRDTLGTGFRVGHG